jgi:RNA polymerase sigma factor (sigma-70 family)
MTTEDALSALRPWRARAQTEAQKHSYHSTKKAVQAVEMTEDEREAAGHLYNRHADTIEAICRQAYNARSTGHEDSPSIPFEDVLQEAYVLLLRALVSYDPGRPFKLFLRRSFRDRVQDYLDTTLRVPDQRPEENELRPEPRRQRQPDRAPMKRFDLASILEEMVEDGDLADSAAEAERLRRMWRRLDPSGQ